jgi:hypothetical protein
MGARTRLGGAVTYLQLKQRLCRRTGKNASSIDTETGTRLGQFLNEAQRELLTMPGTDALRQGVVPFASVASQPVYALPTSGVARINRIWETTNDRKMERKTLDWLRQHDPDPQTSTPWAWVDAGMKEVAAQPADASSVFVKSSSASDTTQVVYVEGVDSLGFRRTANATLTGTTALTLSSAITTWIQIDKFYMSVAAVGTVTLHEDSGLGTELARIPIGATYAEYAALMLYPTPAAVVTYYADVTYGLGEMSIDTDRPRVPEDFHDLILDIAELREITKSDDRNRYAQALRHIEQRKRDFRHWVYSHPDEVRIATGPTVDARSSLGAWYPAGT